MRQTTSTEEGKEVPVEGEEDEENQKDLSMPALPTYAYVCIRVSCWTFRPNLAEIGWSSLCTVQLFRRYNACKSTSNDA